MTMEQAGHREVDALPLTLLATGLRTRASGVDELAGLTMQKPDAVREGLRRLADHGLVDRTKRGIDWPDPAQALATLADRVIDEAVQNAQQRLSQARQLLAAMPALLRDWHTGTGRTTDTGTEIFHGPYAVTDHWLAVSAQRTITRTDGCLPEFGPILDAPPEQQQLWHEAVAAEGHRVRTLLSASAMTHPKAREVLDIDLANGGLFRVLAEPPSWMWISNDEVAGIPLEWGQGWPTSVMAISNEAIVRLLRWLYDRLWAAAVPIGEGAERSWDSLLLLMSQGATVEAASHALGISSRTGRRRLSEAMEHFGVSGSLALGVAWERDRIARAAIPAG